MRTWLSENNTPESLNRIAPSVPLFFLLRQLTEGPKLIIYYIVVASATQIIDETSDRR
jgi:hypothetical protein